MAACPPPPQGSQVRPHVQSAEPGPWLGPFYLVQHPSMWGVIPTRCQLEPLSATGCPSFLDRDP